LDPALHEVSTTDSRQIRHSADFLHAVRWAIAQGLHPRATKTTLTVAEKLAAKINSEGHMAYARERLAAELNVSVSTVRNHTRILRELGLLVWVEHGTRRNILRTKNPTARPAGYKATATIFAAVAPPYWDHAMGRTTAGCGYTARLTAVNCLGRAYETALSQLSRVTGTRAARKRRCPPSVSGFSSSENSRQKGGNNYTRTRETKTSPQPSQARRFTPVTPTQLAALVAAAEQIKSNVPWLAKTCARRLAFQLRDRLLTSTSVEPLVRELRALGARQYVHRPLGFLAAHLRRPAQRTDLPLAWVPVRVAAKAPVPLPRFEEDATRIPDFGGDQLLEERWDAYCAERAFAEALDRWRELDHQRLAPENLVPVYPVVEIAVDDTGSRWAEMVETRHREHAGAFARSASLRAQIRAQWAALRSQYRREPS
jgi:DNA-binding CsgD family transcriptional regulator